MARIAGVNIPTNKRVIIALTYIHGIGRTTAVKIADKLGIDHSARVQDLTDEEVLRIRETIDEDYTVEGDLTPSRKPVNRLKGKGLLAVRPKLPSARYGCQRTDTQQHIPP